MMYSEPASVPSVRVVPMFMLPAGVAAAISSVPRPALVKAAVPPGIMLAVMLAVPLLLSDCVTVKVRAAPPGSGSR